MQQKLFQHFLPQEAGAFGNSIEKKPQKPHPKLKKYVYYIFTENISSSCNPMQVVVFLQKCINFEEQQRLKFSNFEGSILPSYFIKCKILLVSNISLNLRTAQDPASFV